MDSRTEGRAREQNVGKGEGNEKQNRMKSNRTERRAAEQNAEQKSRTPAKQKGMESRTE